jgi:hypothetical protein
VELELTVEKGHSSAAANLAVRPETKALRLAGEMKSLDVGLSTRHDRRPDGIVA